MTGAALLEVRDLWVRLPGREILSGASFTIAPGRIVGLRGDSGSGKTTLGRAIMKLLPSPPYQVRGEVLLNGRNLLELDENALRRVRGAEISCIFQDPLLALNPVLRVGAQIREVWRAHSKSGDARELLSLVGVPDSERVAAAYPHQLSGGERQRVGIAQALACRPSLVIADEPFSALDGPRVVELAGLFRRLRDELGTSFLLVSHSPGVLRVTADEVLRLREGRMAASAAAEVRG